MDYDLIVIGSGPGGYAAAIRASQLGMKAAIIEKDERPGGTCLNVGCIPSKALLDASETYHQAKNKMNDAGILFEKLSFDWERIQKNKDRVVDENVKGVEYLLEKHKIQFVRGKGYLAGAGVAGYIDSEGNHNTLQCRNIILATGSVPRSLPGIPFDKERNILSSTEILSLPEVPEKLVVIGGGVIGVELGSVYQRMGCHVILLEATEHILPGMDEQISRELERSLKKNGMEIRTSVKVKGVEENEQGGIAVLTDGGGEEAVSWKADVCLMAVGRAPNSEGLDPENMGLERDEHGFVQTNDSLQTNLQNVYAIGDLIRGPLLAHRAREDGVFVAERIAGQKPLLNRNHIPAVVYTWPEAAGTGKTEQELKKEGRAYSKGVFAYRALGRARASGDTEGFIKILTEKDTDEVLGIHIFGARAADMIGEAVLALEYRASAEDIARICHAHPTFSEGIQEAALEASGIGAIHK